MLVMERVLINPSARNSQKIPSLTVGGRTKYWIFIHCFHADRTSHEVVVGNFATDDSSELEKQRRIEAVLFLSREAVSTRKLAKLAGLADATEARTLVRQLNQQYEEDGRVFRIEEVAGGMTMLTRPQFAPWLRRLAHLPRVTKLSQSAMETLAVVAYRQPVLRADIEAIRGVGCSEVLKQLMECELVRISGRSEELGRPYLYGTTNHFLQIFGLRSADRLPRADWVNAARIASQTIEPNLESSFEHDPGTSSEAKESTVKMSFSAMALIEPSNDELRDKLLTTQTVRAEIDDDDDIDDDDFDDDDDVDDEDDEFEDDEESLDEDEEEEDAAVEGEELADDEEEELEDEEGEEEDDWEEVDDEDDDWDDEEDEDDDWEEEDDEEEDWD